MEQTQCLVGISLLREMLKRLNLQQDCFFIHAYIYFMPIIGHNLYMTICVYVCIHVYVSVLLEHLKGG